MLSAANPRPATRFPLGGNAEQSIGQVEGGDRASPLVLHAQLIASLAA